NIFHVVDTIQYNGTINNEITQFDIVSYADSNTTYIIRISDRFGNILGETGILSNTSDTIDSITTINYQPTTDTIIDVDIKRISGIGNIYYQSIVVYYI